MVQTNIRYIFLLLLIFMVAGFNVAAQKTTKTQQQFQKAFQFYNLQEYQNAISEIEKLT